MAAVDVFSFKARSPRLDKALYITWRCSTVRCHHTSRSRTTTDHARPSQCDRKDWSRVGRWLERGRWELRYWYARRCFIHALISLRPRRSMYPVHKTEQTTEVTSLNNDSIVGPCRSQLQEHCHTKSLHKTPALL